MIWKNFFQLIPVNEITNPSQYLLSSHGNQSWSWKWFFPRREAKRLCMGKFKFIKLWVARTFLIKSAHRSIVWTSFQFNFSFKFADDFTFYPRSSVCEYVYCCACRRTKRMRFISFQEFLWRVQLGLNSLRNWKWIFIIMRAQQQASLNLFIFFAIKNNKLDEPLHTFHFRQWWGVEKVLTRARIEGITMKTVQFLIRSEPNNPGLSRHFSFSDIIRRRIRLTSKLKPSIWIVYSSQSGDH